LTGEQRVAVAAETRHARSCAFCEKRKKALSPHAIDGAHSHLGNLPNNTIDMIHRIVTDPARLSHDWFRTCLDGGLSEEEYVEILAIVASTIAIDTFTKALGMAPHPLPKAIAGAPSKERPARASQGAAWVSWIDKADAIADDLRTFGPNATNVRRALSLVPSDAHSFMNLMAVQYLPEKEKNDLGRDTRAIDRQQIELIAGRVSAINQCAY
tara:strand:- start:30 stop:665 length:636 start_codon:yes stop_codon:yes gene_type:complete